MHETLTPKTTPLRPHTVVGKKTADGEIHALSFSTAPYDGIVFSYSSVSFKEEPELDKLVLKFEYAVHDVPDHQRGYDKAAFEKELGDFMVQLLYYGLERDFLGFTDENRKNHPLQSHSQ